MVVADPVGACELVTVADWLPLCDCEALRVCEAVRVCDADDVTLEVGLWLMLLDWELELVSELVIEPLWVELEDSDCVIEAVGLGLRVLLVDLVPLELDVGKTLGVPLPLEVPLPLVEGVALGLKE